MDQEIKEISLKFRLIKNKKIVGYEKFQENGIYGVNAGGWTYAENDLTDPWIHEKDGGQFIIDYDTKDQFIGMEDRDENEIYVNDYIKGFNKVFVVKFGVVRRKMKNNCIVDIPSFYFKDILTDLCLYPIADNFKDEHDLDTLKVIGNTHKNILQIKDGEYFLKERT
ncbi:MAG: hypothetical protein ACOCT9_01390 [archaeon]